MLTSRFVVFAVASALCFRAKDDGGGSGGGESLTLEERLTAAEGNVATLTSERDAAREDRNLVSANLAAATVERDSARRELATANASLAEITGERDVVRNELRTANELLDAMRAQAGNQAATITRLESACRLAGMDPGKLPTSAGGGEPVTADAVVKQMKAEADPKKRGELYNEFVRLTEGKK